LRRISHSIVSLAQLRLAFLGVCRVSRVKWGSDVKNKGTSVIFAELSEPFADEIKRCQGTKMPMERHDMWHRLT
jgi:hypothetical protein